MAEEDEDREIGGSDVDGSPRLDTGTESQDEDYPSMFVDRDDDNNSPFVDRDYDDDTAGSAEEYESADPGYAAFASELDDPLADWPAPESTLNDLPEVRQKRESEDQPLEEPMSYRDRYPDKHPDVPSDNTRQSDLPESSAETAEPSFTRDTLEPAAVEEDELVFEETVDAAMGSNMPDVSDGDELPVREESRGDLESLVPEPPVFDEPMDGNLPDEEAPPQDLENVSDQDTYEYDEPYVEQKEAFSEEETEFEEEFVDDFLNDLDPPEEEELPLVDEYEDEFESPLGMSAETTSSSVEKAATVDTQDMIDSEGDAVGNLSAAGDAPEEEGRSLPLGMLAVVAVALILLAVGGFGVMQQRSDMQAEIRDLQAKLATTISPEDAEMERERQRQVQLRNESLSTELEALTAENDALAERLNELETLEAAEVAAAAEKLAREEAAAAKAAADRAARQAAEQAAAQRAADTQSKSAADSVTAKGPWFVNFGSYADRGIANRWADKLTVESGKVVVQTATAAGKTLYRVRVVGLTNQDSAERVATALERQYQLPRLWVGKN